MVKSIMRCAVCDYESDGNDDICGRCGTVYSLFSGEREVEGTPVVSIEEESEEKAQKSHRH